MQAQYMFTGLQIGTPVIVKDKKKKKAKKARKPKKPKACAASVYQKRAPTAEDLRLKRETEQKVKELESLIRGGQNLFDFHKDHVAATEEEKIMERKSINEFASFLKGESADIPGCTVNMVLKSGSLGKGTAVKGYADIDLVVFYNGLKRMKQFRRTRGRLLDNLQQKIQQFPDWKGNIQIEGKTKFSLKCVLNGEELDVLPAKDVVAAYKQEGVYRNISQSPYKNTCAQDYSASLAKLQIEFVKYQDETVKRAIRILKFWKKGKGEGVADIPSYAVELLTIKASQTTPGASTECLVRETLKMLANPNDLRVVLDTKNYTFANYSGGGWLPAPPYIIDPANPYLNVLSRVESSAWTEVGPAAQAALGTA